MFIEVVFASSWFLAWKSSKFLWYCDYCLVQVDAQIMRGPRCVTIRTDLADAHCYVFNRASLMSVLNEKQSMQSLKLDVLPYLVRTESTSSFCSHCCECCRCKSRCCSELDGWIVYVCLWLLVRYTTSTYHRRSYQMVLMSASRSNLMVPLTRSLYQHVAAVPTLSRKTRQRKSSILPFVFYLLSICN